MLLLIFCVNSIQAQQELNGYLSTAATNNPGLKAKFNEYLAALEKVPQVGGLPDPTVSFGYFILPVETRVGPQHAKFSAMQMFPWFGTLGAKKDVAAEMAKQKFELFEDAKSRLYYDVSAAYYNIYFVQKAIDITYENVNILGTLKRLALIRFEAGTGSAVDELRVSMEVADLENQLAYLRDGKEVLEVKFNNLLDVADDAEVLVPDTLWDSPLSIPKTSVMDSIMSQNHQLKRLEHKIMTWEKQETVARKVGLPTFSVGLDYTIVGKSSNPAMSGSSENGRDILMLPKVGITIPIYRKKYKAMVKEASLNMEAARFEQVEKVNQLSSLFEVSYRDYADAERRVNLYQSQLRLAQKSLNILMTEYSNEGKNFEEVLRMEQKVLKYALEQDKARSDKSAATAFIKYLIGK
ncbi:TolC family protein [Bacteroidota bacterium]